MKWAFYQPITPAQELAQKVAEVSRRIEQVIPNVYEAEPNDGYLHRLLRRFQNGKLPKWNRQSELAAPAPQRSPLADGLP
ncbi:hypothetical protein [Trichothermofontia sp.]